MNSSTDDRLPIGYISRAHGIRGEVVVVSDSPDDRFAKGSELLTDRGDSLTVTGARQGNHGRIVAFAEITDRTEAEGFRGRTLTIDPDQRRSLEASEFWPEDLVGLKVVDAGRVPLGTVVAVHFGDAQDRLVVDVDGVRSEIPFVDELVPEVDLEEGVVIVAPLEGLLRAKAAE